MFKKSFLFIAGAALCALFVTSETLAQSITLPRVMNREEPRRRDSQFPNFVSYQDCINDDVLSFDLALENFLDLNLQVWATTDSDCTSVEQRQGDRARCWLLNQVAPATRTITVDIRAQDLVARRGPAIAPNGYGSGTAQSCEAEGAGARQNVTLYFMFVDAGLGIRGTAQTWTDIGYDVVGPPAPRDVQAAPGERKLIVNWRIGASLDLGGYRLFCDPPPGNRAPSDAGTLLQALEAGPLDASPGAGGAPGSTGDAGNLGGSGGGEAPGTESDAGGFNTACPSTVLVPGQRPNPAYECGSTGLSSATGVAGGLVNGVPYTVGVAGVDLVGNIGPLSDLDCNTPVDVEDFFERYRKFGGGGGGGFCAVGTGTPGFLAFATLLSALTWAARRRSRRYPPARQ